MIGLVEHGPFDVEDGLASDQGVVERELAGCGRVAETEFGAVLRDLGQCRETRVDAQFAQQRRGARQQRLTDVEARGSTGVVHCFPYKIFIVSYLFVQNISLFLPSPLYSGERGRG